MMIVRERGYLCMFVLISLFSSKVLAQETVTLSTYYTSPRGLYQELRSQVAAVGPTYSDPIAHPWDDGLNLTDDEIPQATDFVVEGNAGIGTHQPNLTGAGVELTVSSSAATGVSLKGHTQTQDTAFSGLSFFSDSEENASIRARRSANDDSGWLSFYTRKSGTPTEALRISLRGNLSLDATTLQTTSPTNNSSTANVTVNDIYLRSVDSWVSGGGSGGGGVTVYTYQGNGLAVGTISEPIVFFGTKQTSYGGGKNWQFYIFEPAADTPFSVIPYTIVQPLDTQYGVASQVYNLSHIFTTRGTVAVSGMRDVYYLTIGEAK
jgi:hypothetical protein